ncbi:SP family sugar:H+ symporter-like MFS transporter [Amycolatopsis bartoniae]|uniref:Sugar transporter n=1 Tax=Amycolatopsis bartoniae TaxID=941986 RepID=A0A8H9IS54_9PSEU|nr:sugar porter family MFS transporter [Amycolatopsis bartoniae]MBB2935333.1 SP family sugar:H+ symporter-like MFS transporter [Amycolatopsis bartoniae]TVT06766.1 sugar porter family MFS transporter [Amycolatopsis bartoniae]GHF56064.1 sugar transporter [Amycolatopsis bartoniae]
MSVPTTGERAGQQHLAHVVFIAGAAAVGGFLFGYDSSNINGAVLGIQHHFQVGDGVTGLTVSSALIGSAVGAWFGGLLSDRIGRIRTMQLAAVLFLVSAIGAMFPFSVWDLAIWRVVGGIAIGVASVIGPAYIAEVAPPAYRGRLASLQQLAIVLGIGVSALVNWVIKDLAPTGADGSHDLNGSLGGIEPWQWMLGAAAVPAIVYFVLASVIPESPHYLLSIGKTQKARKVLAEVEGGDVDAKLADIRRNLRVEKRSKVRDLVGGKFGLLPIVWVGIALAVFQQFVGINVIFYYSDTLWHSVGQNTDSLLISMVSPVINIIGTFIAIAFIDRVGRKPLLLIGSAGMTIGLAVAAIAFGNAVTVNGDLSLPGAWGPIALVFANLFVISFALSWGVILWVMLGEMFPLRIRSAALAIGTAANWIANWIVTVSFPSMAAWSLSTTYWIYAAFAILSIPFALKFVRETKGTAIEDVR